MISPMENTASIKVTHALARCFILKKRNDLCFEHFVYSKPQFPDSKHKRWGLIRDPPGNAEKAVLWVPRQQQLRLWCRVHQGCHFSSHRHIRNAVCLEDEHLQWVQSLHLEHRGLLFAEEPGWLSGVWSRWIQMVMASSACNSWHDWMTLNNSYEVSY